MFCVAFSLSTVVTTVASAFPTFKSDLFYSGFITRASDSNAADAKVGGSKKEKEKMEYGSRLRLAEPARVDGITESWRHGSHNSRRYRSASS